MFKPTQSKHISSGVLAILFCVSNQIHAFKYRQIENNENFGIFQDDEELKNAVKHKLEVQAQIKLSSLNATHEDLVRTFYPQFL